MRAEVDPEATMHHVLSAGSFKRVQNFREE